MAMPACARDTSNSFSLVLDTWISTSCSRRASSIADLAFLELSSSRMYLAARSKSSALQSAILPLPDAEAMVDSCWGWVTNGIMRARLVLTQQLAGGENTPAPLPQIIFLLVVVGGAKSPPLFSFFFFFLLFGV